jgi:hypothetical protein
VRALALAAGVALCCAGVIGAYPVVSMAFWIPGVALCFAAWNSVRTRGR